MKELLYLRWLHYLRQHLEFIELLRVFRHGLWLNPYTGEFAQAITRDEGKISLRTVSQIAELLCLTPAARSGRLLETHALVHKAKEGSHRSTTSIFAKPKILDEAMEKASSVQQNMLADLPELDGFELAVHYKAHHGVMPFLTGQGPDAHLIAVERWREIPAARINLKPARRC